MTRRYLIKTPTLAVTTEGCARKVIVVPNESVVDVPLSLKGRHGLIEVRFKDETVLMFAEDIKQRGKLLATASA